MNGGNNDNKRNKSRIYKAMMNKGNCPLCAPHRGENDRGGYHARFYAYGKKRKDKMVK